MNERTYLAALILSGLVSRSDDVPDLAMVSKALSLADDLLMTARGPLPEPAVASLATARIVFEDEA